VLAGTARRSTAMHRGNTMRPMTNVDPSVGGR
jgi:hypothetical protein